jgi:hypothetical protein
VAIAVEEESRVYKGVRAKFGVVLRNKVCCSRSSRREHEMKGDGRRVEITVSTNGKCQYWR